MRTRPNRAATSYGRHCVLRVAAALLAVVMLVGVLRAGASYVYCPSMQTVSDAPCCSGDRRAHHDDAPAMEMRSRDCCERHVVDKLPSSAGATAAASHLLIAPLVAVLPASTLDRRAGSRDACHGCDQEGRAGPKAAARHRAELMVSLN